MQQITTPDISALTIDPSTSDKLLVRIPIIIEKLAQGSSVDEIARDLGIHRSNVYRTLRHVDFAPVVDLCIERAMYSADRIEGHKDKSWMFNQIAKTLHSKKVVGEVKHTTHNIDEQVKTLRLALDHLDPDTVLKLNEALKRAGAVEADYTVKNGTVNEGE